jgi:hypothetical protein
VSTNHRETADATELVDPDCTGNKCSIFDNDMAAEENVIGTDDIAADFAIVTDVRTGHEHIVVADSRRAFWFHRAMNRDELAECISAADNDSSDVRRFGNVLRCATDDDMFTDVVVLAECRSVFDDRVRADLASLPNHDVRFDHGKWSDRDILSELSVRTDESQGMNV